MPHEIAPVQVVSLEASLLDAAAVRMLIDELETARRGGASGTVVDARAVKEVAEDGLAALLHWAITTAPRERRVVLAGAGRALTRAICQTRLQRELDVYGTLSAAKAACRP